MRAAFEVWIRFRAAEKCIASLEHESFMQTAVCLNTGCSTSRLEQQACRGPTTHTLYTKTHCTHTHTHTDSGHAVRCVKIIFIVCNYMSPTAKLRHPNSRRLSVPSHLLTRMIWSLMGLMSWKLCWFTRL